MIEGNDMRGNDDLEGICIRIQVKASTLLVYAKA